MASEYQILLDEIREFWTRQAHANTGVKLREVYIHPKRYMACRQSEPSVAAHFNGAFVIEVPSGPVTIRHDVKRVGEFVVEWAP